MKTKRNPRISEGSFIETKIFVSEDKVLTLGAVDFSCCIHSYIPSNEMLNNNFRNAYIFSFAEISAPNKTANPTLILSFYFSSS